MIPKLFHLTICLGDHYDLIWYFVCNVWKQNVPRKGLVSINMDKKSFVNDNQHNILSREILPHLYWFQKYKYNTAGTLILWQEISWHITEGKLHIYITHVYSIVCNFDFPLNISNFNILGRRMTMSVNISRGCYKKAVISHNCNIYRIPDVHTV